MNKRILSLLMVAVLAILALVPAVLAEEEGFDPGYFYVYTENGKSLNVRNSPGGGDVVGGLAYGARIHVEAFTDENWALILFRYDKPGYGINDYACWVSRRFLTRTKPEPRKKSSQQQAAATDPLEEINKEFKEAKKVTPYKATIRPARASGWVNMHWAPSNSSELLANYKANDHVLVIRELANWFQVEDQDTGDVGFISKQFLVAE
ncbi:MAG: SH3 domain-containing protein [Clostridia bacterium]|nr:SH3 domain-containing protein [Clostridia bacterium]